MQRPKTQAIAVAAGLVAVGAGMVVQAAIDPTDGLAGRRFEGIRWVSNGHSQALTGQDGIALGFSSTKPGLLADTDCSDVQGTFRVSGGRLFLADTGSLGSDISSRATPTLPGTCYEQPRRERAEQLNTLYEHAPTLEIRADSLVLRGHGSTLVLTER